MAKKGVRKRGDGLGTISRPVQMIAIAPRMRPVGEKLLALATAGRRVVTLHPAGRVVMSRQPTDWKYALPRGIRLAGLAGGELLHIQPFSRRSRVSRSPLHLCRLTQFPKLDTTFRR